MQFFEVFDDGRGAGQFANLPETEVEDGLLDIVHLGGEVEKHRVDHAEQPGGERRIAPDDLGDLRIQAAFGLQQLTQRPVDAGERSEFWARIDTPGDFGFCKRRGTGGGNIRDHRWHG